MKRLVASVLVCTLLAGCATAPNGDYDDRNCKPFNPGDISAGSNNPGDVLVGIVALLVVEGLIVVGCEAAVEIGNGWRHYHPKIPDAGFYLPPDRLFSVAIPRTAAGEPYQAQEKSAERGDTVLFLPPKPTPQDPVFGVASLKGLDPLESTESLDAFSQQVAAQLPGLAGPDLHPQQLFAADFAASAVAMHLVVYRRTPGPGQDQAYQLLYFVRDEADHSAAVLSVAWPQACPHCVDGPESAIRGMDPRLENFVESFRFMAPQ